jgi:hypothetical protein
MSSIKPKGPHAPGAPDAPADAGKARGAGAPRESFKEAIEGSKPAVKLPSTGPLSSIADDLRAGKIDASTAVDRLVARALSSKDAASLPPARRAELEAQLRSALADDPALVALTKDLERAR